MTNDTAKPSFFDRVAAFFRRDLVNYVCKRILVMFPSLLLISLLVFAVIQLPPGDYLTIYLNKIAEEGETVTEAQVAMLKAEYDLDKPFIVQYVKWVAGIIYTPSNTSWYRLYGTHHNWKFAFSQSKPVWSVIKPLMPLTIGLTFAVMVFQYLFSIPVSVYSATHQYSFLDYVVSFIGFIGSACPGFVLAILCMVAAYKLTGNALVGLFTEDMTANGINWSNLGEFLSHCIIPFIVLGLAGTCGTIRQNRGQMLDQITQQYTLTARAKGVKESTIIWKYCFRAAANPLVNGLGGALSSLFSGSTVSAMVLNINILGPILYEALKSQDMYLAGGIIMTQAFLVQVGHLLADIGLAFLDPRIRYSGGTR